MFGKSIAALSFGVILLGASAQALTVTFDVKFESVVFGDFSAEKDAQYDPQTDDWTWTDVSQAEALEGLMNHAPFVSGVRGPYPRDGFFGLLPGEQAKGVLSLTETEPDDCIRAFTCGYDFYVQKFLINGISPQDPYAVTVRGDTATNQMLLGIRDAYETPYSNTSIRIDGTNGELEYGNDTSSFSDYSFDTTTVRFSWLTTRFSMSNVVVTEDITPVPLPAGAWLLLAGLLPFWALRRRGAKQA